MNVLLAALGAWVFVNHLRLHKLFPLLNRKPFACEVCMGGWFALGLYLLPSWFDIPFYMSGAMIVTILVTKLMSRF